MKVPPYTVDLIVQLKEMYKDSYEIDPKIVGTPEYWMHAGVIDLIRKLETNITHNSMKEV